jgi:predicted GNAT family acetyltransferase
MDLTTLTNAGDFLDLTRPALEADEAANNLMFGLALSARNYPARFQPRPYFAVTSQNGRLCAAALMTPPHNLIVFSADPAASLAAFNLIARDLLQAGLPLPGVLGPNQAALAFAQSWQALTGTAFKLELHERVYELRRVIPPPQPPGEPRLATLVDLELVASWLHAFHIESVPFEMTTLDEDRQTARLKIEDGNFFLWDDRQPVALAGKARPTPHGQCVGPVYTPPRFRRKGYATALTAALSQSILDSGKQFSVLFTDLSNPISNGIYMKIGYNPVCDFDMYTFI